MKRVHAEEAWPDTWKRAYAYDLLEVYGQLSDRGYDPTPPNPQPPTPPSQDAAQVTDGHPASITSLATSG